MAKDYLTLSKLQQMKILREAFLALLCAFFMPSVCQCNCGK